MTSRWSTLSVSFVFVVTAGCSSKTPVGGAEPCRGCLTTEADPKVGTLLAGGLCTANAAGTGLDCTAPVSLSPGGWCRANAAATGLACSAATPGAAAIGVVSVSDFGAAGDGVADDSPAIQAAVDAAGGRAVHLPPGTFLLRSTVALPDNTTLRGSGIASAIRVDASFRGSQVVTNSKILSPGRNANITVADLALEISDFALPEPRPGILRFEKVDGLSLTNILTRSIDTRYTPLDLAGGVRNALISGCRIVNVHSAGAGGAAGVRGGVDNAPTSGLDYDSSNIIVSGNHFESAFDEAFYLYGWNNAIENVTVIGNVLVNRGPTGLALGVLGYNFSGQDGAVRNVAVVGNAIVGVTHVMTGASDVRFSGNSVVGPSAATADAVFVASAGGPWPGPSRVSIDGNVIRGAGRYAIFLSGADVVASRNVVTDASAAAIYGGAARDNDIVFTATGHVGIENPAIAINNTVTNPSIGIQWFGDASSVLLQGNLIKDPSSIGINLNGNGASSENCILDGNTVRNDSSTMSAGIALRNGTFPGAILSNNRVHGASASNYDVPPGSSRVGNFAGKPYAPVP